MKKKFLFFLTFLFFSFSSLYAAPILYNSEADLFANLDRFTTYDFEASSGFYSGYIGLFDGINFDASIYYSGYYGSQVMTSFSAPNRTAFIDFTVSNIKPNSFGFYGLDLKFGETIKTVVNFSSGASATYDVTLKGASNFTPIYFGLIAKMDTISAITISGTELIDPSIIRAWLIDDLTIGNYTIPMPEPATMLLLGSSLIFIAILGRKRLSKKK